MFNKIIGNEKAVIGGLSAGILTLLGQLGVNNQMTLKEVVYALVTWVITHVVVYSTTNTPIASPVTPTVVQPTTQIPVNTPLHPDITPIGSVPGN
jgi:hypothetical protein